MAGTRLLLVAALNARLLQQLAVLLLRHPLASLLDDRAHCATYLTVESVKERAGPRRRDGPLPYPAQRTQQPEGRAAPKVIETAARY